MKKVGIFKNKNNVQATLTVLQDFYNITQGVCSGKSQILSTKPILEADSPLSVQGLLSKLDHQQCALDIQPVLGKAFFCTRVVEVVKVWKRSSRGPQSRHWRMPLASEMRMRSEGLGFRRQLASCCRPQEYGERRGIRGRSVRVYSFSFSSGFSSKGLGRCSIS